MLKISRKTKINVEFFDVDSMNIVWHGNYIKYIEIARCEFLKSINYTYIDMKNDGYAFPIVKLDFKYIKPAFFGDILEIETVLAQFDSFLKFTYIIRNFNTKEKLSTASTHQVAVKIGNNVLESQTPNCLRKAIEAVLQ